MEVGREGHSGLYTMHFSNLFPPEEDGNSSNKSSATTSPPDNDDAAAASAAASSSPPTASSSSSQMYSLMQFSQWHVLIRMNVENEVCFVKGEAKVFSPTPSLATPAARGLRRNGKVVVVSANTSAGESGGPAVPVHQRDRKCHVLIQGSNSNTYRSPDGAIASNNANNSATGGGAAAAVGGMAMGSGGVGESADGTASAFRLEVHLDRLEGELLGLSSPAELRNVVLSCGGHKTCGWHMGVATVATTSGSGKTDVATPAPLRFLLKPYYGPRCTYCLDPVYATGYTCAECEVPRYCSRECLHAHMRGDGHALLCPYLKERYRCKSGVVTTEVSDDTALIAWWRCLDKAQYSILVDSRHALGYAMELTLSTLRSAADDGLQYRYIVPRSSSGSSNNNNASNSSSSKNNGSSSSSISKTTTTPDKVATPSRMPSDEEVIDFVSVLLREVNRSAILEHCVSLSAACLSYLFVFSPFAEITIQAHVLFFTAFHCEEFDGPISTVEEYVAYARPLHALATLQMEYALKSPIASEFWRRIKIAKDVVISLFTINANVPCADVPEMRPVVVTQQCETLTLLCKVFVVMASRAPHDEARRWLEQAEKCLRQCCDSEAVKADGPAYAILNFRLATLLLLYREESKTDEARQLRAKGEALLRAARADAKTTKPA